MRQAFEHTWASAFTYRLVSLTDYPVVLVKFGLKLTGLNVFFLLLLLHLSVFPFLSLVSLVHQFFFL